MSHGRVARHDDAEGVVSRLSFAFRYLGYHVELRLYQRVPVSFHGSCKTSQISVSSFVSLESTLLLPISRVCISSIIPNKTVFKGRMTACPLHEMLENNFMFVACYGFEQS